MSIANTIEKKLLKIGKFEGAKVKTVEGVITEWEVDGIEKPSEETLNSWKEEIDSDDVQKKDQKKSRKQAVMAKLGLSKAEVKALKELLDDGNDD